MLLRALLISLLLHFFLIGLDRPMVLPFLSGPSAAPMALSAPVSSSSNRPGASGQDDAAPIAGVPRLETNRKDRIVENSGFDQNSRFTAAAARQTPRREDWAEVGRRESGSVIEPVPSVDAVSPEGERLYRLSLAREARHFRHYPELARAYGWEGEVVVTVATSTMGGVPVVSLGRSSGHRILDDQAIDMMAQAVGRASIPPEMLGRNFRISIPLEYRLAD